MKIHWQNIAIVLASLLFVSVFACPVYAEDKPDACPAAEDAQDTNTIIEGTKNQLLRLNSSHFLDQTGALVPNEIVTQDFISSLCETNIQPPLPGEALWLRFSVQNENDHPINWAVTFMETIFDRIVLYELRQDNPYPRNGVSPPLFIAPSLSSVRCKSSYTKASLRRVTVIIPGPAVLMECAFTTTRLTALSA